MDKNLEILINALHDDVNKSNVIKMSEALDFNKTLGVSNLFLVYSRMYAAQKDLLSINSFNKLQKAIDKFDTGEMAEIMVNDFIDTARYFFNYTEDELEKLKNLIHSSDDTAKLAVQVTEFLQESFKKSGLRQVDLYFNNNPSRTIDDICKVFKVSDYKKSIDNLCVKRYVPAVLIAANFMDEFIPKNVDMEFSESIVGKTEDKIVDIRKMILHRFESTLETQLEKVFSDLTTYFNSPMSIFKHEIQNIISFFSVIISRRMDDIISSVKNDIKTNTIDNVVDDIFINITSIL